MKQALELGKNYDFVMNLFEPKDQKMTLVPADIAEKKATEALTAAATAPVAVTA
jgi:hypothetical protein